MAWKIRITDEAKKDYSKIEGSIRKQVLAGIIKVSQAPLPSPNGYGKPLGNKNGNNLTGFFKIKYRGIGIRVVYTLVVDKMSDGTLWEVQTALGFRCYRLPDCAVPELAADSPRVDRRLS